MKNLIQPAVIPGGKRSQLKYFDYSSFNFQKQIFTIFANIAGRLPENNRNSFVDLQPQKTIKKTDQKIRLFIEGSYVKFWSKICISFCCLY